MKKKEKKEIIRRLKDIRTHLGGLLVILSLWFAVQLLLFGMLSVQYQFAILFLLVGINVLIYSLMYEKKAHRTVRLAGKTLCAVLCVVLLVSTMAMRLADSILKDMTNASVVNKDISLIVKEDSPFEELQDFAGGDIPIGIQNAVYIESTDKFLEEMGNELSEKPVTKEYGNLNLLINGLKDGDVQAIVLDEAYRSLVQDEWDTFSDDTRIIYSVNYSEKQQNISKKIDVTNDPFLVMISGIDTYGDINTVSRSDVNILAAVNPQTGQILLVSIPRDYYVPIQAGTASTEGNLDKLTHSGLFGPTCTVRTVENIFDYPINYYVRVNFTSVVDIVNAIGGITVHSDMAFGEFQEGDNYCDGERALAFARERYSFEDGDRERGRNQMKVIEAVVSKLTDPSLNYDYMGLIQIVRNSVEMNFSDAEIKDLVQFQVVKRPAWTVQQTSVNGTDAYDYSTFYGTQLYVMYPDQASIDAVKVQLQSILGYEAETDSIPDQEVQQW